MDVRFYFGSKTSYIAQEVLGMYDMSIKYDIIDIEKENSGADENSDENENSNEEKKNNPEKVSIVQTTEMVMDEIKTRYQVLIQEISDGKKVENIVSPKFRIENLKIQYFICHQTEPFNVIIGQKSIWIECNEAIIPANIHYNVFTPMRDFIISLKKDESCRLDFCGIIMDYDAETKTWINSSEAFPGITTSYCLSDEDRDLFIQAMRKLYSHINDLIEIVHMFVKTINERRTIEFQIRKEEYLLFFESDK